MKNNVSYNKEKEIELKFKLPYKEKEIELKFKKLKNGYYKPVLIFGRNGMGKTSIRNDIFEKYGYEYVNSESLENDKRNKLNVPSESEEKNKTCAFVYGRDFQLVIDQEMISTNLEEIEEIENKIKVINDSLNIAAREVAMGEGSNKHPDKTTIRKLSYQLYLKPDLGAFNRIKKLRLYFNGIDFFRKLNEIEIVRSFYEILEQNDGNVDLTFSQIKSKVKEDAYRVLKQIHKDLSKQFDTTQDSNVISLQRFISHYEKRLNELNNQKSEVLATERKDPVIKSIYQNINTHLKNIFYSSNRIEIFDDIKQNKFSIRSNKTDAAFIKLSTGEQNILSLCYFFERIFYVFTDIKESPKDILIVLDDIITSVDFDNKVGIYSFLKYQFQNLLEYSKETKFLILTHDEEVFYHFQKVFDDIRFTNQKIFKRDKLKLLELNRKELVPIKKDTNFYSKLLNDLYNYAKKKNPEDSIINDYIGNIMRRVLEAYGTFNYQMGIDQLTTDESILSKIEDKEERKVFKSNMYRLILHSESHTEDYFKEGVTRRGDRFSVEEKQYIARLIIAFLFRLDPNHLLSHICLNLEEEVLVLERRISQLNTAITKKNELLEEGKIKETTKIEQEKIDAEKKLESKQKELEKLKEKSIIDLKRESLSKEIKSWQLF